MSAATGSYFIILPATTRCAVVVVAPGADKGQPNRLACWTALMMALGSVSSILHRVDITDVLRTP